MQAMATIADLHAYYHHVEFPVSFAHVSDPESYDDKPLPEKSANQKEMDRHAYYFKFADKTEAKLRARGLLVEKTEGSNEFEARPDARESLRNAFSEFLTSFVNFGANNEVARPVDIFSGIVSVCQGGMAVIAGPIFVFNKVVAVLKEAFPSYKSYFDQTARLTYFSSSTAHSLTAAIQPAISQTVSSVADPIFSIILVSIEILLGFYATVTATESGLAQKMHKSELLSKLVNKRKDAEIFFKNAISGEKTLKQEAAAYEEFMTIISKLDELSKEAKFGTFVTTVIAIKEWLWFGGSVVGNETAYRNIASAEIAVSGAELVGTAVTEMALALVANIMDIVQGVVVYCRCEEKIASAYRIKKQLGKLFKERTSPVIDYLINGLAEIANTKIHDEEFEQRFSLFRAFKALTLVVIGIVSITALALGLVFAAPWILGLTAGVVTASLFLFLIVRSIRKSNKEQEEKKQANEVKENNASKDELINMLAALVDGAGNKSHLLHFISIVLVDEEDRWVGKDELGLLFDALNLTGTDMAI